MIILDKSGVQLAARTKQGTQKKICLGQPSELKLPMNGQESMLR